MSMDQAQGARDLVLRARMGDQNAMGMIQMVGQNARQGDKRAQAAFGLIQEFIRKHPPNGGAGGFAGGPRIGAEAQRSLSAIKAASHDLDNKFPVAMDAMYTLPRIGDENAIGIAIIILANGQPITAARLKAMDGLLTEGDQGLFRYGHDFSRNEPKLAEMGCDLPASSVGFLCAGHCVGTARRIQLARLPQVPVSILGADIGWELGHRHRRHVLQQGRRPLPPRPGIQQQYVAPPQQQSPTDNPGVIPPDPSSNAQQPDAPVDAQDPTVDNLPQAPIADSPDAGFDMSGLGQLGSVIGHIHEDV